MFKIVFFNHKGGVSKTTTTYNLGWMLASMGHKTLIVDGDPQCNLTSLILGEYFDEYYLNDETKSDNIKDGVKAAFEGKPKPIEAINCPSPESNSNLFLLAGHPNLSEYETSLSFAQNSNNAIIALMNLPGAFNELINKTASKYDIDFVLIDLNPGLSAINQNLFMLSNAFIIPTNPDPFSIMAIETLSDVLPRWAKWAESIREMFKEASYPLWETKPKFIGEIIQRFNIRNGKAANPYRSNIEEIKSTIKEKLIPKLQSNDMLFEATIYSKSEIPEDYCITEIPDFQSLLPKSHDAKVPVFKLTEAQMNATGSVLDNLIKKQNDFKKIFEDFADKIVKIKEYAGSTQPVLN